MSLAGCAISGHIPEANDMAPVNGINRKLVNDSSRNSSGTVTLLPYPSTHPY